MAYFHLKCETTVQNEWENGNSWNLWKMQSKKWYNIKHIACANETYNNFTRVKCKFCNMQKMRPILNIENVRENRFMCWHLHVKVHYMFHVWMKHTYTHAKARDRLFLFYSIHSRKITSSSFPSWLEFVNGRRQYVNIKYVEKYSLM